MTPGLCDGKRRRSGLRSDQGANLLPDITLSLSLSSKGLESESTAQKTTRTPKEIQTITNTNQELSPREITNAITKYYDQETKVMGDFSS